MRPISVAVERRDDLGDEEMKVITEGTTIRAFGKKLDPRSAAGKASVIEKVRAQPGRPFSTRSSAAASLGRTDSITKTSTASSSPRVDA